MNYRHLFHAGNFADVVKHILIITLINALSRKESPFCYLDTHAGLGLYPLNSIESSKSKEYLNGINKLIQNSKKINDPTIRQYIHIIEQYQATHPNIYPGSPSVALSLLRQNDQMILSELHPNDFKTLKQNMGKTKKVAIHHTDGYSAIKAFLPPKQKRGLVLIDPPFEQPNEFEQIIESLQYIKKHWQSGNIMIWYPIKNRKIVDRFYKKINNLNLPSIKIEISLNEIQDPNKMNSCGLLLINPPWQIDTLLKKSTLPEIAKYLNLSWVTN